MVNDSRAANSVNRNLDSFLGQNLAVGSKGSTTSWVILISKD